MYLQYSRIRFSPPEQEKSTEDHKLCPGTCYFSLSPPFCNFTYFIQFKICPEITFEVKLY